MNNKSGMAFIAVVLIVFEVAAFSMGFAAAIKGKNHDSSTNTVMIVTNGAKAQ